MTVVELVIAAILAIAGVRSLLTWIGRTFSAASTMEHIAYALHITGRVGLWFAFAGFFAGYALVDEPQLFAWYVFVPVGLAGMQLLTGLFLSRSSASREGETGLREE
ncbi:hypothetical protein BH20ACT24_BH20ACT24_17430 [soil metagenome]